jgi:predicted permease
MAGSGLLRGLGDRYPLLERASMEPMVFAFALLVSVLSVGVLSLSPAFRAARTKPVDALSGGQRVTEGSARRLMVATQVAVTVVLLAGASLTLRSLWRLQAVDPGFDLKGKLTAGVWLPYATYREPATRIAFFDRLLAEVEALPGVETAAVTSVLPLGNNFDRTGLELRDRTFAPGQEPSPDRYAVSPGYLEMMGIRRIRGRGIEPPDREGAPAVVVVSESLAAQLWPGEDPLGRQLRLPFSPAESNPWREVVGVVADVRQYGLDRSATPALYVPEAQYPFSYVTLVVSSRVAPESLLALLVRTAREIDPDQALFDLRTGEQLLAEATLARRLPGAVLSVLAAVVLAVAGVGLFGVVALGVAERTREIGIRLTLGARRADIRRSVLGDTARMVGGGLGVGLLAAWPLTRLLRGLLFGVEPHDPASLAVASVTLVVTALLATWIPVRRAGRVEPMEILRSD